MESIDRAVLKAMEQVRIQNDPSFCLIITMISGDGEKDGQVEHRGRLAP